jgi:YD repeat-containing protein
MSRLTSLLVRTAQSTLQSYAYTYDAAGNRLSMTDNLGARYYTYDKINQVAQATNPLIPAEQYAYDLAGNRLGTTVDAGNRLLETPRLPILTTITAISSR